MLDYKFPKQQIERDTIKQMTPEQVSRLRDVVKHRMENLLESCNDYFDNLIESDCYICAKFGYAYFDIPDGWGYLKDGQLLCDGCITRWTEKFGEPPAINREGEIAYEHGTVSEDTSHRGQADFRLVFG